MLAVFYQALGQLSSKGVTRITAHETRDDGSPSTQESKWNLRRPSFLGCILTAFLRGRQLWLQGFTYPLSVFPWLIGLSLWRYIYIYRPEKAATCNWKLDYDDKQGGDNEPQQTNFFLCSPRTFCSSWLFSDHFWGEPVIQTGDTEFAPMTSVLSRLS